jgi:hypothetical protein
MHGFQKRLQEKGETQFHKTVASQIDQQLQPKTPLPYSKDTANAIGDLRNYIQKLSEAKR